ncbi:MAG TPA: phosphoribosylanthranilate isomerase [Methylomirabilota bacterium]|nr:phosphoribosylanthranilate isomerase [Methylomirabilota bacterium]
MSVRVKICGVTNVDDAVLAVQFGADLIGFNFYPLSPRCVTPEVAREIRAVIPVSVQCVGVFVNAERRQIADLVDRVHLDFIQFHGDEPADALLGWPCQTIKAVRIAPDAPLPDLRQIPARYLLLDTYRAGRYGGTGETFGWERIASLIPRQKERLILAGGLTLDNVVSAVRTVRPWAVDVASGVEAAPGRKDPEKLRAFITNAKTA